MVQRASTVVLRQTASQILGLVDKLDVLQSGIFFLASGRQVTRYFDGFRLSLDCDGAQLLASAVLTLARDFQADAVGGPELSAAPIVGAALALTNIEMYMDR